MFTTFFKQKDVKMNITSQADSNSDIFNYQLSECKYLPKVESQCGSISINQGNTLVNMLLNQMRVKLPQHLITLDLTIIKLL